MFTVSKTHLEGVLTLEPKVFRDHRGFFYESFNSKAFNESTGLNEIFVQDNHSRSSFNVLRGMHFQTKFPQGKLVRVISGSVIDVVVDLRRNSPTFKKFQAFELSSENFKQLWIPKGFAHGFLVRSEYADFLYKTTDFYRPDDGQVLLWNDPTISIKWPYVDKFILSDQDLKGKFFNELILPE